MSIVNVKNAELLRDAAKKNWKPPLFGLGSPSIVAKTATMQALEFLGEMTTEQTEAVVSGLREMQEHLK